MGKVSIKENQMVTIYKYSVPITDEFELALPLGAHILAFQNQDNEPVIWALVNSENEMVKRKFAIRGTGNPIESSTADDVYIGTIQTQMGLVWHLFEVEKK